MHNGYWASIARQRITRRRAVATCVTTGAAIVVGLSGCGGSGGDGALRRLEAEGLLSALEDTTSSARPGGVIRDFRTSDIATLDPHQISNATDWNEVFKVYSRLFKLRPTVLKEYDGSVEGDLVESWEFRDGGTELALKLRPNASWHDVTPVNRRAVDSQDVVFSWERFESKATYRASLSHLASPVGPIESVKAVDPRTVTVKLAVPTPTLVSNLAAPRIFWILPREAEGKFDPRNQMIGSGPWILETWSPSVAFAYRRNPDWYVRGRPFAEWAEFPIVPEYAARLSQFRAGNIDFGVVNQQDLLATKRDLPDLIVYKGYYNLYLNAFFFGLRPGSPFRDERVRQAMARSLDRDLWADTFYNVPAFRQAGLQSEVRWLTILGVVPEGFWLDPQDSTFGPNAKFFQYDVAEAKRLLAAAGFANGLDVEFKIGSSSISAQQQGMLGMMAEAGIRSKIASVGSGPFVSEVYDARGNFDGFAFGPFGSYPDPDLFLFDRFHSQGGRPALPADIDPRLDGMVEAQRRESDAQKRRELIYDFQRYMAGKMYLVPQAAEATVYDLAAPRLKNIGVYRTASATPFYSEVYVNLWVNSSR